MAGRDLIRVGDTLYLGKADWVFGDRSMTVRVSDICYGLDDDDCPVVGILATITSAGREGRMAAIGVYKCALTRLGVVQRQQPSNGVDPYADDRP